MFKKAELYNYYDIILIKISELVSLEEVMETMKLGPNGALIYCMEFLWENIR